MLRPELPSQNPDPTTPSFGAENTSPVQPEDIFHAFSNGGGGGSSESGTNVSIPETPDRIFKRSVIEGGRIVVEIFKGQQPPKDWK
jgi:hypothetical protein